MTGLKLRIQSPHENCKSHMSHISKHIYEPSSFFGRGKGSYHPSKKASPKKRAQFYPYLTGKLTVPLLRSPNLPLFQGTRLPGFRENSFTQRLEIERNTLQGINISHLGKRKIIFKMPFLGDMLVPWRVCRWFEIYHGVLFPNPWSFFSKKTKGLICFFWFFQRLMVAQWIFFVFFFGGGGRKLSFFTKNHTSYRGESAICFGGSIFCTNR